MTRDTPLNRRPYCRRSAAEWDEIRRLYQAGATAKALVKQYGGTERTLYTHARENGWLRKDDTAPPEEGLTQVEADAAVRRLGADDAVPGPDAACRALGAEASLGDAARAAAATAIAMLRDGQTTRAYAYARMAGTLERLARGAMGDGGGGEDPTEPGRVAALDFLRREGVLESLPSPSRGEGSGMEVEP